MTSNSNLADRLTAVVLCALGLAMAWGGFEMDRLEIRRIHPASIPGLVPMILGVCMVICAVFLGLGSLSEPDSDTPRSEPMDRGNWMDLAFAAGWSCCFAIMLVGRVPFIAASAIYIAVFSAWYLWPQQSEQAARTKMLGLVAVYAGLVAAGVSALFQYGFLVRLP
jgi:putative tricarboxylic transport membrane protein